MEQRKYYRTIVLSDIHLGTSHSKTDEVCHFLSNVDCGRLILNGDIIDGWHLKKSGMRKWQPYHTRFFKILMKMMERKGTQVVYVRGNHDDFLDGLAPLTFYNISIVREYELESRGRRYFVTHGDIFDRVTTQMKWLALLGDVGYSFLLSFNSLYNRLRATPGAVALWRDMYRTEWAIFDEESRVAGTLDFLDYQNGKFSIYDWKRSNKVVDRNGTPEKANRWGDHAYAPIAHIVDTTFWHYALQVSIYRYILEKNYGIQVSDNHLAVFHPDYDRPHVVDTPYLKDEVISVLNKRKSEF